MAKTKAKKKPAKPAKRKAAKKPAKRKAAPKAKKAPPKKAKAKKGAAKPRARQEPAPLPWRVALEGERRLGVVDDYFSHVGVIAFTLEDSLAGLEERAVG